MKIEPFLLGFTVDEWIDACPLHNKKVTNPDIQAALEKLYDHFSMPGKPAHDILTVKGGSVPRHTHPEWTLIYYVLPGEPPCAILVDELRIEPIQGCAILLPPKMPHSVEPLKGGIRLSIALRWEEDNETDISTTTAACG